MTAPSQQLYRNGTVSRDSLPLWYRVSGTTPTTSLLKHIPTADTFHNGSISQDSLPLWYRVSGTTPTTSLLKHIPIADPFRNGSIPRDLLPLRCSESVGDFGFTYAMGS
ncbi:MAG TPA: hypothetical protein IAB96_02495 [Candidatus Coprenecus pullicola]|nr:hypothetical protein [Candidatus Coprenecus pullicola]